MFRIVKNFPRFFGNKSARPSENTNHANVDDFFWLSLMGLPPTFLLAWLIKEGPTQEPHLDERNTTINETPPSP